MASRRRARAIGELRDFVGKVMRRLQLRCFQALTTSTPVLTGFARSGWSPSTGQRKPGPAISEGAAARGVTAETAAALTRSQAAGLFQKNSAAAAAIASSYRLKDGVVFIVNNVRYAVYLNQGSSAQAPAMFVEQSLLLAVNKTRQEIPGN